LKAFKFNSVLFHIFKKKTRNSSLTVIIRCSHLHGEQQLFHVSLGGVLAPHVLFLVADTIGLQIHYDDDMMLVVVIVIITPQKLKNYFFSFSS